MQHWKRSWYDDGGSCRRRAAVPVHPLPVGWWAGWLAACANFASRFVFSQMMSFAVVAAVGVGVGMVKAFVLMRRYDFTGGRASIVRQAGVFSAVNAIAVLQTVVVSSLLLRVSLHSSSWTKGVNIRGPGQRGV